MIGEVWRLYAGDELVAELEIYETDQPWVTAHLRARESFERFRDLFDEEWAACEAKDWDRERDLQDEIRSQLWLQEPDGTEVREFLLHVSGDEGWWRWRMR